jgi:hypothetical protein
LKLGAISFQAGHDAAEMGGLGLGLRRQAIEEKGHARLQGGLVPRLEPRQLGGGAQVRVVGCGCRGRGGALATRATTFLIDVGSTWSRDWRSARAASARRRSLSASSATTEASVAASRVKADEVQLRSGTVDVSGEPTPEVARVADWRRTWLGVLCLHVPTLGRGGAAGTRKKKDMRAVRKKKDNPKEEGYPRSAKLLAERCRLRT